MRCHYDVLEVERTADDEQIKRAYRKLALKWHPDKNPDRIDECNQYFTLIQQAYDVLSDAQERAWYDRHREQILRGGFDEHFQDNSLNLFSYFTSSCYVGFGDDEKGFYAVYRRVFETLAAEDYDFLSDDVEMKYPTFGDSMSSYEEVVGPFYGFWQSYSTARSFVWLDKYDIRGAPNRFVVRAMEKENKKLRDAGKKERNEEVRHLVAYVRKRDKRVLEYRKTLEARKLEQQRKNEENRMNMIRESLRQMGEYKESEEVRQKQLENLREIEEALDVEFGVDASEDSERHLGEDGGQDDEEAAAAASQQQQQLYCIVCEKVFKTEKAMGSHERSKKHRDAVTELKKHMQDEDVQLLLEPVIQEDGGDWGGDGGDGDGDDVRSRSNCRPEARVSSSKKSKKQKRRSRNKASVLEVGEDAAGSDGPDGQDTAGPNGRDAAGANGQDAGGPEGRDAAGANGRDAAGANGRDTAGPNSRDHLLDGPEVQRSDGDLILNGIDGGQLERGDDEQRIDASVSVDAGSRDSIEKTNGETNIFIKMANLSVKKAGKDAAKKAKGQQPQPQAKLAAAAAAAVGPRAGTCDRCGEIFESRSKLFAHLKSSGHATLKVDASAGGKTDLSGGKPAKKGKRK